MGAEDETMPADVLADSEKLKPGEAEDVKMTVDVLAESETAKLDDAGHNAVSRSEMQSPAYRNDVSSLTLPAGSVTPASVGPAVIAPLLLLTAKARGAVVARRQRHDLLLPAAAVAAAGWAVARRAGRGASGGTCAWASRQSR